MNKTSIEYLDFTSNPIVGCDMSLPCAERCWARRMAHRLKSAGVRQYQDVVDREGNWTGKTAFNEAALTELLRRREPATIGLGFMGDAFHESVPDEWIDRCAAVVALTPHLKHLWLTKRAKRMREHFSDSDYRQGEINAYAATMMEVENMPDREWPLDNLALGVSVENRAHSNRIEELRQTPAAMRFLSLEPLLEDLGTLDLTGISWVICGGESGPGARPMPPEWPRAIRDQCVAAGVPYFHKQNGEWSPSNNGRDLFRVGECEDVPVGDGTHHRMFRVGKKAAGRLLDGKLWDQRPEGWR